MKTNGLAALLLLVFLGISCDRSEQFVIDGQKKYILSNQCGTITIKGSSFSTFVMVGCTFNGKYSVNTDLLKIEAASSEDTVMNIRFRLNNKGLTEKEIEIESCETLSIDFNLQSTVPYQKSTGTVLVLPSNFILCEDKPIITDTIRIQLKK